MAEETVTISPREAELEDRVKRDQFDSEAWEEMANSALQGKTPARVRSVMERLLERYPFAFFDWVRYLEFEDSLNDEESVKNILRRVLKSTSSVEIWIFYLNWLKRPSADAENARSELRGAFEQAVKPENVGWSMEAHPVWRLYIDFLLEEPENTPYEQGQKLDSLRKVYRQALVIPIRGLEVLWREYTSFESSKHERTAKQLIEEIQKDYTHAAEVLKEREQVWRPVLPSSSANTTTSSRKLPRRGRHSLSDGWMRVLAYERTNPEQVPHAAFRLRVRLAYRRALQDLYFQPDCWYGLFEFERSVQDAESALTVLRESLRAMPESELMHFCLADALEAAGQTDEARGVHEALLDRRPGSSLAYIERMRFARRVDGVGAAREVFRRARQLKQCDPAVYCCAGEIEWTLNKQPDVAKRVMDLALKRFPTSARVVHTFLDLVLAMNDELTVREVLERCYESLMERNADPEDILGLLERYRTFARDQARDLTLVAEIERRIATKKNQSGIVMVLHRYCEYGLSPSFEGLDPETVLNAVKRDAKMRRGSVAEPQHSVTPTAASTTNVQEEEDMSVPPFLRKLVSILPRKLNGIASMDVEFVLRHLVKGTLPPPPTRQSVVITDGQDSEAAPAKKRRSDQLGAEGAPVDAFKQRQKRTRA